MCFSDNRWSIELSYDYSREQYSLQQLRSGSHFSEGLRLVTEAHSLYEDDGIEAVRIRLLAEPGPGRGDEAPLARSLRFRLPVDRAQSVFLNGYQSWSESRELDADQLPKRLRPLFSPWIQRYNLENYGDAAFSGRAFPADGWHGFSFGYIDQGSSNLFIGGLAEERAFSKISWFPGRDVGELIFEPELSGRPIRGVRCLLDLLLARGDGRSELFDLWAREAGFPESPRESALLSGWTSWYDLYEAVSEEDVRRVLSSCQRLKLPWRYIQIDDGWQRSVGDWLETDPSFSGGMEPLAREIREIGCEPGLWLAPCIAEEDSELLRDHPEWFVPGRDGKPQKIGYNPFHWSGSFYALSLYHPEVREYLRRVFDVIIRRWGFRLLKLDFLYAAALFPPPGKTRGEAMRETMRFLREISAGAQLLCCGVPLLSAAGLCEFCRTGPDVSLMWEDRRLAAISYPERVSTLNALRTVIGRAQLNGRLFSSDPDVFFLRDWNCKLDKHEQFTLFLVNNIFGSLLFTSDDPGMYSAESLDLYRSAFPLRRKEQLKVRREGDRYTVFFSIGQLEYLACINLGKQSWKPELTAGLYYDANSGFLRGEEGAVELEPHASVILLRVSETGFSLAGSSGRLFPGSDLLDLEIVDDRISFSLSPEAGSRGELFFRAPVAADSAVVNGRRYPVEEKVDLHLIIIERSDFLPV